MGVAQRGTQERVMGLSLESLSPPSLWGLQAGGGRYSDREKSRHPLAQLPTGRRPSWRSGEVPIKIKALLSNETS